MSEFSFSWSSALRVTPAVTRLTVNRRLKYGIGKICNQMGQRLSVKSDEKIEFFANVEPAVNRQPGYRRGDS